MTLGNSSLLRIFLIYLRLGCISFGGPVAHLGYFKHEFVDRRKWLDESTYAELLGLCQFIPGPSSSQLCFAIGWQRGGIAGACLAWLGFVLPSVLIMIGFAYSIINMGEASGKFIHGLLIAAVAVVANAILGLGQKLCADVPRILIALLAGCLTFAFPGSLTQIAVILLGGILGNALFRATEQRNHTASRIKASNSRTAVYGSLLLYAVLLFAALAMLGATSSGAIYAHHYRAGALVFGGGHVVLPLLHDSLVGNMLLSESSLLAGYSAAQALPGPLFALASYLGTIGAGTHPAWLGGIGALIALFLPGMLLLIGLLPFWNQFRHRLWAQAGLMGANAAVVGLLLTAFITPVWTHGITSWLDLLIASAAFYALYKYKAPAWLVVLSCGVAGFAIG
jgi:chromate transporter